MKSDGLEAEIKGSECQFLSLIISKGQKVRVGKLVNIATSHSSKVDLEPKSPSLFGTIQASEQKISAVLSPVFPSTVVAIQVSAQRPIAISPSYFLAATSGVDITHATLKVVEDVTLKTPTSLFMCTGNGTIWLSAGGEHLHFRAESKSLYQFGAIIAFSPELIIRQVLNFQKNPWAGRSQQCYLEFSGDGIIHLQSRDPLAFGKKISSISLPQPTPLAGKLNAKLDIVKEKLEDRLR